jgi:hypothetical protein
MDNDLFFLDFNNAIKLSFKKEINSLEFVEIIGNMASDHCIKYKKRDTYLKNHGKQLLKKFTYKKKRKIQIKIKHETKYLSNKRDNCTKLLNNLTRIINNIFNWKITVTINIVKYKYGAPINIKQNDYNNYSKNTVENHVTEILSQEEIDMLLTAIVDNEKNEPPPQVLH